MNKIPVVRRDHFTHIAPQWSHFGPPLRPFPGDAAVVQRVVSDLGPVSRALVLGLTPEIIGCTWPGDVSLTAVDHSAEMISALWPPEKGPKNSRVVRANWCSMPIPSGTIDLVAGDGCYVLFDFPHGYATLTQEVHRVLRPGGRYVIRVFMRPDHSETVAEVARALADGAIGSVHSLKLRLHAAVHGASGPGSRLDDVWRAWSGMSSRLPAHFAGVRGWSATEIATIESYGGMQVRYFLPTLAEFRRALQPWFVEVECAWGGPEPVPPCPTLVLEAVD